MSKATKRKYVTREVMDDYVVPENDQMIVKILSSKGNNLHEAESATGNQFLISMPSKFRKNVWIKRGNYVIVDKIKEGNKVCAEIVHILYPEQIKNLKKEGLWPENFAEKDVMNVEPSTEVQQKTIMKPYEDESDNSESDSDLFVNTNHLHSLVICSASESSEDDDCDEQVMNNCSENNNTK